MITITDKDLDSLEKDLSLALVKFSDGKLNIKQSKILAKVAIKNIDFSLNSALAHKGINWYAKEILDIVDFDKIAS